MGGLVLPPSSSLCLTLTGAKRYPEAEPIGVLFTGQGEFDPATFDLAERGALRALCAHVVAQIDKMDGER